MSHKYAPMTNGYQLDRCIMLAATPKWQLPPQLSLICISQNGLQDEGRHSVTVPMKQLISLNHLSSPLPLSPNMLMLGALAFNGPSP